MKKTKIADESEKNFEDFFEHQNLDENSNLSFVEMAELSNIQADENSNGQPNFIINLLKQVFLFLPGTFLLYIVGFVGTIIAMDIFVFQRSFDSYEVFGLSWVVFQISLLSVIGLLGIFMTWFGLGDIKNKKHFSIPASILISSATLTLIFMAIEKIFGINNLLEEFNHYYFYLLPLILIIPILVKGWVDKETE